MYLKIYKPEILRVYIKQEKPSNKLIADMENYSIYLYFLSTMHKCGRLEN